MRRVVIILVVLAVLVGGSLFIYRYTSQAKEPPAPDYEVIKVDDGDMISTVSATGTIQPEDDVSLIFKAAGRVGEVLVKEGDSVTAGQVLARLETSDLDLAQAQAEIGLSISQAQLAKLKNAASESDVAAARAALESAQAAVASAREAATSAEAMTEMIGPFQEGFSLWRQIRPVVVAAVQGHAIGAGFQLALAADVRVVADDVQFAMKELSLIHI